ncbi:hypothetical protein MG293_020421 [Ovis ammon polii]|uniref:Uncharacterized protein n=1 Tax=Ovis ammon polii TaxID=230172 RepID=A0AAD4TKF2_OVIAM|nr:hypothetical protein MG293_020421 [Ovis ammon polii]
MAVFYTSSPFSRAFLYDRIVQPDFLHTNRHLFFNTTSFSPRGPQAQAPTVSDSVEGCAKAAGGPTSMITEIPSPHLDVFPALPKTIDMTTASLTAFLTSPAMLISATNHSAIHSVGFITESRNRNRFTNRISTCTIPLLKRQVAVGHLNESALTSGARICQSRLSGIHKINYFHHECRKPGKLWSGETSEDKWNCVEPGPCGHSITAAAGVPRTSLEAHYSLLFLKLLPVKLFMTFKPKSPTFSKTWK